MKNLVDMFYYAIFASKPFLKMSDRINQLIDTIREKSILFKDQVASEKSKNEVFAQKVEELENEVVLKTEKVLELNARVTALNEEVKTVKEQKTAGSDRRHISDEQIDELVKEIEYCIGQLKK